MEILCSVLANPISWRQGHRSRTGDKKHHIGRAWLCALCTQQEDCANAGCVGSNGAQYGATVLSKRKENVITEDYRKENLCWCGRVLTGKCLSSREYTSEINMELPVLDSDVQYCQVQIFWHRSWTCAGSDISQRSLREGLPCGMWCHVVSAGKWTPPPSSGSQIC
jgi:hypothetical protein